MTRPERQTPSLATGRVACLFVAFQLLMATESSACPVCYSAADPVVTDSVNAGIFVLLGVTTLVLAAFGRFIVSLVRLARLAPLDQARQT